jgi:LAO/AO transport system kinase
MDLAADVLAGKRLALARLLTLIENDTPEGHAVLDQLFARTGKAHLIGVTGAPGSGKSSLVNQLARAFRNPPEGQTTRTVAIVAVDPSSPFTGGALLGDRVRMRDLAGDPGVFIRSMAARGALGGLARTTAAVVQALDAAGFEIIMIETVGAGQSEVEIARLAHTTLVIEAPGMGDDIQAIKAGILEIADILVVNKADRPGADNTERLLLAMLEYGHPARGNQRRNTSGEQTEAWIPPVLLTVATQSEGILPLVEAIQQHAEYLKASSEWQARDHERLQSELEQLVQHTLVSQWRASLSPQQYRQVLDDLVNRRISPYQALDHLLAAQATVSKK